MLSKRALIALITIGCLRAFFPANVWAVSLTELFQGQTITADDKLFSHFALVDVQSVNGGFANLDLVDVTPLVDDPLNPGIKFTAPTNGLGTPTGHTGFSSVTVIFEFDVQTTTNLPWIKDNSLLINDYLFDAHPDAFIQITELVRDASGNSLGDKLAIVHNGDSLDDPDHFDSLEFTPQALLHVRKTISIVGPLDNDGARLLMFEQRFSQVPEPGTWLSVGLAWLCLSACRRRLGS